jgi:hypothetical protein
MVSNGRVDPELLNVSYIGDTMAISLCGLVWMGTEDDLDALFAAFIEKRSEARTHRAVMDSMLPRRDS